MKSPLLSMCLAVALVAIATSTHSAEVMKICAKYKASGKQYKVDGHAMTGQELNEKTQTFNYSSFSKYVVVFWGPEQASVIKLAFSFGPSIYAMDGVDQQGREWEISTNTTYCF